MTGGSEGVLGQGLLRAATRAVNLCFAGVAATSSVILHSWTLFGASLAGYATLVVWDLTRLGFWERVLKELRTRPPPLPDSESFTDPSARHFLNRLHLARVELRRVLQSRRAEPPRRLVAQLEAMPEVEMRAVTLIDRLEDLSRYLGDKNLRGLRNEVERMRRASENTTSPRLRAEYRKAHFALAEELAALEEIAAAKDLLLAKLETLTGSLEMFPCEIVRLQVLEADARDGGDDLPFDPRAIIADSDTVEEALVGPLEIVAQRAQAARSVTP